MHPRASLHRLKVNTRWSALALLLALLVASLVTTRAQTAYNEAPGLAQRVTAGELPPVGERLPEDPMVVEPVERIGMYGGVWRTALRGGGDQWWLVRTIGYEHLVRWSPTWEEIIPNIAASFEVNEEATEFTFRLRQGMNWSDGEPFSADDIMFWYENVYLNEELTGGADPAWLRTGEDRVVVEKLDDTSVVFRFASPNSFFLQNLALGINTYEQPTNYPRHYLEQFHIEHNPEGIDALVQEAGVADWVELFEQKSRSNAVFAWSSPDLPTLHGWMLTTGYSQSTTRVVAERNPYFWKVDPEGNQLPYIDRVVYDQIENIDVLVLRALGGEIDMMDRHIGTLANRAVFADNQERGGYHFFETIPSRMNTMIIVPNLTHEDPVKREIFNNKDFRIGLSHAINRQELIDLIYVGQGEPYQAAPRPEAAEVGLYNERLAKQYTEYDVELANEHLDRAGYSERDAQGFRLGPDGNRITFQVEIRASDTNWIDAFELIEGYWRDVGLNVQMRPLDRALLQERINSNQFDVTAWSGDGGLNDDILLDPRWYVPITLDSFFARPWASWYLAVDSDVADEAATAGTLEETLEPPIEAEEPPAEVQQQMARYDQMKGTADREEQLSLMQEILEMAADQFYVMGISLDAPGYGIVKNNFHNVPQTMFYGTASYLNPAPTNPVQYFIDDAD